MRGWKHANCRVSPSTHSGDERQRKSPRDGLGKHRRPRSYAPRLAQAIQQEEVVQPARSRAQTGD